MPVAVASHPRAERNGGTFKKIADLLILCRFRNRSAQPGNSIVENIFKEEQSPPHLVLHGNAVKPELACLPEERHFSFDFLPDAIRICLREFAGFAMQQKFRDTPYSSEDGMACCLRRVSCKNRSDVDI